MHDDNKADGRSLAIFRFKAPQAGDYELRMAYSAHATRATKTPVVVTSGQHETRLTVDQTQPVTTDQTFRTAGFVQLVDDIETVIEVSNTDTDGFVILDALQLIFVGK